MKATKKMMMVAAAFVAAIGLAACDEEALKQELDIDTTETTATDGPAAEAQADFYTDATSKIRKIELAHEAMGYDLTKYSDPAMMDDADTVAESIAKIDELHEVSQVEFMEAPEDVSQSAKTSVAYFETYKELEAQFHELLRAGLSENDSVKINKAVEIQSDMNDAFGITVKSMTIALEGK